MRGTDPGRRGRLPAVLPAIAAVPMMVLFLLQGNVHAAEELYVNPDTGCRIVCEDGASLISGDGMAEVLEAMEAVTEYADAGLYTVKYVAGSTEEEARRVCNEWFGQGSSVLFVIDMDNRNIWIWSNGRANKTIRQEWADVITDNVYRYASEGDYAGCSAEAFRQLALRLRGGTVPNPLRLLSSLLLAFLMGLAVMIELLSFMQKKKQQPDVSLPLEGAAGTFCLTGASKTLLKTTKKKVSSTSSGGHLAGGTFRSGGGGGGRSSGGGSGGGHRF